MNQAIQLTDVEPGTDIEVQTTSGTIRGTVDAVDSDPSQRDSLTVVHRLEGETHHGTAFLVEKMNTGRVRARRGSKWNPSANVQQWKVE